MLSLKQRATLYILKHSEINVYVYLAFHYKYCWHSMLCYMYATIQKSGVGKVFGKKAPYDHQGLIS